MLLSFELNMSLSFELNVNICDMSLSFELNSKHLLTIISWTFWKLKKNQTCLSNIVSFST